MLTTRTLHCVVVLLVLAPVTATAQTSAAHPTPDHFVEKTFTMPVNEFSRLWLDGGHRYRIELTGTGISLALNPVDDANEPVLIKPVLLGESASHTTLYTAQVRDTGLYDLRAVGGEGGREVTVHITEAPPRHDTDGSMAGHAATG